MEIYWCKECEAYIPTSALTHAVWTKDGAGIRTGNHPVQPVLGSDPRETYRE